MNSTSDLFARYSSDPEFHFEVLTTQVGSIVARRMSELSLTRSALARRLDASPAWVTQLLRGDENITLRTLGKLAVALEFEWTLSDFVDAHVEVTLGGARDLALAA